MAAGDVVIGAKYVDWHGLINKVMVTGTVTLDAENPTPIDLAAYVTSLDGAVVSLEGSTAPGADPTQISSAISGTIVNVYAWKITAADNGALIASTDNTRLVNFIAIGTKKAGL